MNFDIMDLFRGKGNWQTIVPFIIIALFGIHYMVTPARVINCVNGKCTVSRGDKVLASFNANDIAGCSFSEEPYERCRTERRSSYSSSSREYVREKCRTEYKYLPQIRLNNGTIISSSNLYTFYSGSSAARFCQSVKNNPNYKYEIK